METNVSWSIGCLVLNGKPGPWSQRCDLLVLRLKHVLPDLEILVQTPLGLLPYSLEDLNPFAQVDGPSWLWKRRINTVLLRQELQRFHIDADRVLILDIGADSLIQASIKPPHQTWSSRKRNSIADDAAFHCSGMPCVVGKFSINWSFVRMLVTKKLQPSLILAPTSSVEPVE